MNFNEARKLGAQIADQVRAGSIEEAFSLLAPILKERTPFNKLRAIGYPLGEISKELVDWFIDRIAVERTEGGWVVIAAALEKRLAEDLAGALRQSRKFIIEGDVWYCADVLAEGVAGNGLVMEFEGTLALLDGWRFDKNHWVRRSVGVGAHYWAKRSKGNQPQQARQMLDFLEPLFYEKRTGAVKGIGWGLKTIGRYYPSLISEWLASILNAPQGSYRTLMLRKAQTYLPDGQRVRPGV